MHSKQMHTNDADNNTVHCFVDDSMISELLDGFEILDNNHVIKQVVNKDKTISTGAHYYILAKKIDSR
jgi:hypothetical protein